MKLPANQSEARRRRPALRARGAFTITELLIVVGIVILLLGILIVAVGKATQTAQSARTRNLMSSLSQALTQFKADVGYYPPVLAPMNWDNPASADELRALRNPPGLQSPNYADDIQDWYSISSLPEYLIGYGDVAADAFDGAGIRTPGRDGVWGATRAGGDGSLAQRNSTEVFGAAEAMGRVFGPYLQTGDERLLASADGTVNPATGLPNVHLPGEGNYDEDDPKVLVDYWGTPIRYYRRPYPPGALGQSYRPVQGQAVPTLQDVILLRPYAFSDTESEQYALQSAEFAIFSAGPDRTVNPLEQIDPDEFNRDNIVETGP